MNPQGVKMIICALVLFGAGLVSGASSDIEAWGEFKLKYEKNYTSQAEEMYRMKIFIDNKRNIDSYNTRSVMSFVRSVNYLSDLTTEEINSSRNGFKIDRRRPLITGSIDRIMATLLAAFNETSGSHLPTGFGVSNRAWYDGILNRGGDLDWRKSNRVSRVKNQGSCGSCWAFSATGALESILASRNKSALLSEQNLVDCSRKYGNQGCDGGMMDQALDYVRDNGIMFSHEYPYTGTDDETCKFEKSKSVMNVRGSVVLPRGNELLLRLALAITGPLPVAVDAGKATFHSYKSGIYNDRACRNDANSINHAMLLVGYGSDPGFGDYWILKNSWGLNWGENGYIRLARNMRNLCGVATYAVLPIP